MILIPSFAMVGESANFVKDIDVLFAGLVLKVNGNRIASQKEPFLYDENLFVSLKDLAKGLEMDISLNGNSISLDSKGKINESSKQSLVFQRGYQVLAKERLIEALEDEVRLLEGKNTGRIDYEMKATIRNIKVGFGGISLYLDKKKLNLDVAPLKYNNDFYVAIDSIAPYLFITPTLSKDKTTVNIDTNGVLVNPSNIDFLLSMREGRDYLLNLQREELENKKHILKDLKLPYKKIDSIKSLENYLNSYFSKVGEMETSIKVSQQSNWVNLDISFPSSKNNLWYKLKRSDVEGWIWNIYTAVLNLYSEDALIAGVVRNPYYNYYNYYYSNNYRDYVYFNTRDKDIYFDFTNSRLLVDETINPEYLVEMLNKNLAKHYNIDFSYEAKMSAGDIELLVCPHSDNFNKLSLYSKMGYLKILNQRIRAVYPDVKVIGKLIYPSGDISSIDFYISENRVRSKDLLDETTKYINNSFGSSYGFKLNYSLFELDLKNFHLVVEGGFSVEDDRWINAGDAGRQQLNSTIHSALSSVISLWDANLTVDILDKNGVTIFEYGFYQEKVSLVSANPSGGQVTEGTIVQLWTNTPGARIYYTKDGTTPTTSSDLYDNTAGIPITKDMTIKAFGYMEGLGAGDISTFNYTVVKDPNASQGLTNLVINDFTPNQVSLNPPFSQGVLEYTAYVDGGLSSILITPYANYGIITVNDSMVSTGSFKEIPLKTASTTITIRVKETDKEEKVYTVTVIKDTGVPTFEIKNLIYNTSFEIFSGTLTSNKVTDFSSYTVKLFSSSNVEKGSASVNSDGKFSISEFELDWFDKIFGVKYRVYDGSGKVVISGDLK